MTQLTIDGQPALLKTGTSFKLTRENPYFTNSGDYTLDVQLPLDGCPENQRIFGALHRPETTRVPFVGQHMDFRLYAPPLDMEGKAIVTAVTDKDVKVQLVAGTSAVVVTGEDRYIDELELGEAYDNIGEFKPKPMRAGDERTNRIRWLNGKNTAPYHLYGGPDETPFVNFPVWSETDEAPANERTLIDSFLDGKPDGRVYRYAAPGDTAGIYADEYHFATQPYLMVVVRRVLAAIGYDIRRNDVAGTWMERIFIASARNEYKIKRILPHWTVKEFIEEVRRFFGICLKTEGNTVDLVRRADYYAPSGDGRAGQVELRDVVDEGETTLDEDSDSMDTSAANVDYGHDTEDAMLRLPDDVWENAEVMEFETERDMNLWISDNLPGQADRAPSKWLFVERESGRTFAFLRSRKDDLYYLAQVDCCPPLIRHGRQHGPDGRDVDVELRIVPARMAVHDIDYVCKYFTSPRGETGNLFPGRIGQPMLVTADTRGTAADNYSVNDNINPDATDTDGGGVEPPTVIEVALNTGRTWTAIFADAEGQTTTADLPMALGIAYVKWDDGYYMPVVGAGNNDQFRLTSSAPDTIATTAMRSGHAIDTRCQHQVRFTDRGDFDPMAVYLIRGRRYACLKLEYTIDEQGVQPLKTGYFYEIGE